MRPASRDLAAWVILIHNGRGEGGNVEGSPRRLVGSRCNPFAAFQGVAEALDAAGQRVRRAAGAGLNVCGPAW